ncbi:MAG: beta strand repeat-containing protein, partial [Bacteroidales bacterium]
MTNLYTTRPALWKNLSTAARNLFCLPALFVLMLFLIAGKGWGQSTVFADDFGSSHTSLTSGGTPTMTYSVGSTTSPAGITAIATNVLQQYASATPANGREYFMGLSSAYSYPYNSTTLHNNPGVVTWSFNIRLQRNSSSTGLDAGQYGSAIILATNNADPTNAGASGYAVVLSKNAGATNQVKLVSFANGLTANANTTTIIGPSPDLATYQSHASVKVVFTPSTDTWQFYYRDDLTVASVDPLSGTLTQVGGSVVNSTYTSSASYTNFGFFYNHSTAASASNKAMFDNFKVQVNVPVTWTSGWPKAENPTPTGFTAKVNANVAGTSYFVVVANGSTAPSSAQVKAGQNAGGSAAIASGSIACAAGSTEYSAAAGGSLASSTAYDVYFVAQDASGSNLQASPVLVTVTTTGSATAPLISSPTATTITNNTALLGGNITSDGGSVLTERGTVWGTSSGVSISDNKLAEGGTATGIFTQSRTLLPAKTHIYYKAYATNIINTTLTSEGNFFTLANEPTSQVTAFTATATSNSTIDLAWTSPVGGADGFFVLQRQSSAAPSGVPADATVYPIGTTLGLGAVAAYVTSGATTNLTISGLSSGTIYSFKIMSVNSDGINAGTYNYFTSSAPTISATTLIPPAVTYTWNQTGTASWATASNWTPTRTTPEISDILQFNGGGSIVVTSVPGQTISQLLISNNTSVELQSSTSITLNIRGEAGVDIDISSGSALSLTQATNVISIVLATGTTGTVGGSMYFNTAAHRMTAIDASTITFQNGATFTAGASFSGNAFGTATASANSVVFANGSKYIFYGGSNPFALTAPSSIVVWQPGSTYVHKSISSPSLGNRTYANFELDQATG